MKNMKERLYVSALSVLALVQFVAAQEYNASFVFSILRESGLCVPQTECSSNEHNNTYKDIPADCSGILVCDGSGTPDFYNNQKKETPIPSWTGSTPDGCSVASFARKEAVFVSDSDQFYLDIGKHDIGAIILIDHMVFKSPFSDEMLQKKLSDCGYPMIIRRLAILGACESPQGAEDGSSIALRRGMCVIDGRNFSSLFDISSKSTSSITLYNLRLQHSYIPAYSQTGQPNLGYGGSAIQMTEGGAAYLFQVDIFENKGMWGGAIKIEAVYWNTKFICVQCRFRDNYSITTGGGCVFIQGPVTAVFIDTSFDNCISGDNYTLTEQRGAWGGAVTLFGGIGPLDTSIAFFMGCSFSGNIQIGGNINFSMEREMFGQFEKYVDVFSFCNHCTTVFDLQPQCSESDENDTAQSFFSSDEGGRKRAIIGGNCEGNVDWKKSMIPSPQRILFIPSLPSYGSIENNAGMENDCQDGLANTLLNCTIDTSGDLCLLENTFGKPMNLSNLQEIILASEVRLALNYTPITIGSADKHEAYLDNSSRIMNSSLLQQIFPGDIDVIKIIDPNCSTVSLEDEITDSNGCLFKLTLDTSRYDSIALNLPLEFDLQIGNIDTSDNGDSRPKDHTDTEAKYITFVVISVVVILAVGVFVGYFRKQRFKHVRRYRDFSLIPLLNWIGEDLESTSSILALSGKENKEGNGFSGSKSSRGIKPYSDSLANWPNELEDTLKDILIPYADLKIEKSLARGAQAEVYKGNWGTASVALKKQLMQHMKDGKTMVNKLMEGEVAMMKKLRHPHVVQLFGLAPAPPYVFIVMEFMSRGSLKQLLDTKSEALLPTRRLHIAYQISEGMQFLHRENIIHRDLKPGNVFISEEFVAKVGDFGLSRHVQTPDCNANSFVGTPGYMAPEVSKGSPYTFPADVWSFGSLIHELITGKHYYADYSLSGQIFTAILEKEEMPEIKSTIPGWSIVVLDLVEKCCSPNPLSRPSFVAVRDILKSEVEMGLVHDEM